MRYLPDEVLGAVMPRLANTQAVSTPATEQIVSIPVTTSAGPVPYKPNWLLIAGVAGVIAFFVFKKKKRS